MPIRQTTIDSFARAFHGYEFTAAACNQLEITCLKCGEVHHATVAYLRRKIRLGSELKCDTLSCQPMPEIRGFTEIGEADEIKCDACGLRYHHEKKTKYFVCYCQLKTKQKEQSLYRKLQDEGDFKLSREVYFNKAESNHKCDIKAVYEDLEEGRLEFFIEIDDINHFYASAARNKEDLDFIELFQEVRTDNQYHIRIYDALLGEYGFTAKLVEYLKKGQLQTVKTFCDGKRSRYQEYGI